MPSMRGRIVWLLLKYRVLQVAKPGETIAQQRKALESASRLALPPRGTRTEQVLAGGVPAEWVTTPGAATDRVLLYLHGGSYNAGSPRTHRALAARLSRASGARALTPDYRLAPEHRFPAAVEDATAVYRWLLANDIRPERIVVAGDSAGGGLALALAVALRDAGEPLPAAVGCISPWTDLAGTGASMVTRAKADPILSPSANTPEARCYLGDADLRTPLASPLYADLHGLPPLLLQVGDDEILLDDSTRLAERAREAGVEVRLAVWPGMWHVWHAFAPFVPEAQRAIDELGAFVRERVAVAV
jgi:epsilon-lactone hydrolase